MIALKNTHVLVVVLFLLLLGFKVALLLLNKHKMLDKARTRTRVLDMIFGTLTVVTGGYLGYSMGFLTQPWLLAKVLLLVAAVPLGIIGLRKHNKLLSVLSLALLLYAYGIAETKSPGLRPEPKMLAQPRNEQANAAQPAAPAYVWASAAPTTLDPKELYLSECARCHGPDGHSVMKGVPSLAESTCTQHGFRGTILSGRGMMPSFRDRLSSQQIGILTRYALGLRNPDVKPTE